MTEENLKVPDRKKMTQPPAKKTLAQEVDYINFYITRLSGQLKTRVFLFRLYVFGFLAMITITAIIYYGSSSFTKHLFDSGDINAVGFLGFIALAICAGLILEGQATISSLNAQIDGWKRKERNARQFAESGENPSYFNSLVRINLDTLTDYYSLVKAHTDNSFKVALGVCIFGFLLIGVGLTIGFINFIHYNIVSYIASGSGVLTELISSIFFALYNRTVRQMKEYHNGLLTVQNILLSFKLVGDTQDENEKAKLVGELAARLVNQQNAFTSTSDK